VSRFTKNRNSPSEEVPVQWEFRSFEDGQIYITHKEADGLSVLLDWVRSGLTSASDIGDEMGLSKGQVSKMAKKAIDMGVLVKNGRSYAIA
jgi:DNA-binding MarR family transcriptional regulator